MGLALAPADWLALVLRTASLIATLMAAGTALFVALTGRDLERTGERIVVLGRRATLAAIALVVAQQGAEAGRLAGSLWGIADPALQRLLLTSDAGYASGARIVGLALLLGTRPAPRRRRVASIFAGVASIGVSYALMGHTATHPLRWLLAPALASHVIVAAFWFGALLPLLKVVQRESRVVAARVVARFSTAALWLVPWILIAGLGLATLLSPGFARLATPFDRLLGVKIAAFLLLMALAAVNKWRFSARLETDAASVRALALAIRIEWAAIALVLALTAILTALFSPHD